MAQAQNTGQDTQNTVQITRRRLFELIGAAAIGGIIGSIIGPSITNIASLIGYQQQKEGYTANRTYESKQEIITITYTQPPVTKTVTETKTVTKTATKTETVTETYTKTVTETKTATETLTKPSPTTTTTTTVQSPRTLEEVLFGNSNLEFTPLKVLDAKIVSNNAVLLVESCYTRNKAVIEIPLKYLSRGNINDNINIANIFSRVNEYNLYNKGNYSVYFVLGRANVDKAIELNGKWILPASSIYYNIIISDKDWKDVYDIVETLKKGKALALMPTLEDGPYPYSVWGGSNQLKNDYNSDSIIIVYQNEQQVKETKNAIKLASYILGKPNDKNPTNYGILHVDTVTTVEYKGKYENGAPIFTVKDYKGTIILFIPDKGNPYVSD